MPKQTQVFENNSGADMLVDMEMSPDRYVLRQGEAMEISYEHEGDGPGLRVNIHPRGLQIFLDDFYSAIVTIDGVVRKPWTRLTPEQQHFPWAVPPAS